MVKAHQCHGCSGSAEWKGGQRQRGRENNVLLFVTLETRDGTKYKLKVRILSHSRMSCFS